MDHLPNTLAAFRRRQIEQAELTRLTQRNAGLESENDRLRNTVRYLMEIINGDEEGLAKFRAQKFLSVEDLP